MFTQNDDRSVLRRATPYIPIGASAFRTTNRFFLLLRQQSIVVYTPLNQSDLLFGTVKHILGQKIVTLNVKQEQVVTQVTTIYSPKTSI